MSKKRNKQLKQERKKKYNTSFESTGTRNSTKGSNKDVIKRQKPTLTGLPTDIDIDTLLRINNLARIILTAPVEDMLKNEFDIKFYRNKEDDVNEELYNIVWNEIKRLNFIEKLKDLLIQSRRYGYSLLYYITAENNSETALPLSNDFEILGLNVFDKYDIQEIKVNKNKTSIEFDTLKNPVIINTVTDSDLGLEERIEIDTSRLSLSRGYIDRKNPLGVSIFDSLMDTIVIVDTTEWSIAQLIYRANFLVYKTSEDNARRIEENGGLATKEQELNASTVGIVGQNDILEVINGTTGLDPKAFIDAAITILSVHTNIPKQRLMGNTQGTLSGSEEDAKKYAEYLKRYFNTEAVPVIKDFIDKVLQSLNLSNIYYEVTLESLIEQDEKDIAETEKLQAQALESKLSVINAMIDLMNKVGINPTSTSLENIAGLLETGENLSGEELKMLFEGAVRFSETNLEIDAKNVNIKQQALSTLSLYEFKDKKQEMAEFIKTSSEV